jgi:hypothetical protein
VWCPRVTSDYFQEVILFYCFCWDFAIILQVGAIVWWNYEKSQISYYAKLEKRFITLLLIYQDTDTLLATQLDMPAVKSRHEKENVKAVLRDRSPKFCIFIQKTKHGNHL